MKFSRNWIGEYVDLSAATNGEPEALSQRLTAAGLAVEYQEPAGDDVLLDIDVTTNRVDAMSHVGLAREVSTLYGLPLTLPSTALQESAEPVTDAVRITIEDGRCARFSARVVRGVKVGPSPEWLVRRLAAVGGRSINNVVDVTNYVLWELGKPIHAYDLATLAGAEIRVRAAREGETLVTLDGVSRKLDPEILVIADAERAVGVGGVMGGEETEVTGATVDVLIESAHFDPRAIRRGAQKLGLKTDASHRFERGADPEITAFAADRAARLIQEIAGGEILSGVLDVRHDPGADWVRRGRLDLARLDRFMGVAVDPAAVEAWLTRLGFELRAEGEGPGGKRIWQVRVPTWRYYDFAPTAPSGLCYEADLFEEVARIHGLDDIPATFPPHTRVEPPASAVQLARRRVQEHLAACGHAEAINFAFHDPPSLTALPSLASEERGEGGGALELVNPLSELYSVMRRSLLPGLLASARFNQRRGASAVRLFEVGRVFFPSTGGDDPFPVEVEMVGLVAGGNLGSAWEHAVEIDFYDLKGAVESLAECFGRGLRFRAAPVTGMVDGTAAEILTRGEGEEDEEVVGLIGRLAEEESYPLYAAELRLDFLAVATDIPQLTIASRFPGVAVDLTFTHALSVDWEEIRRAISEVRPRDLVAFRLKDRYTGKGVPGGAVNTTIAFAYNAADRSLTQEEVNERNQALAAELHHRFGLKGAP